MLNRNDFLNLIEIIENALRHSQTIEESSELLGYPENYYATIQSRIEASYLKGTLSKDDWDVYSKYQDQLETNLKSHESEADEIDDIINKINQLSTKTKHDPEKKVVYELGKLLVRLKDILSGNYIEFVEANLPFSQRTARGYTKTFFDLGGTYISDKKSMKREDINSYLKKSKIESNDENVLELFNILNHNNTLIGEDDYDDRSKSWVDRDEEGNIIRYNYSILIQDLPALRGSLSPVQMEEIYSKYPYVTQSSISRDFPYLTFVEFRKILRCFNITKDKLFPLHIIEQYTEEQLAEFALKAKETAGMKRMIDKKSEYFEKRFKDTQKNLYEMKEGQNWIEGVLDNYFNKIQERTLNVIKYNNIEKSTTNEKKARLFCFISDLHIGKCYQHPIYGRGFDKEIARERFEKIAEHICKESHNYENLTILCGGDLTESIMEDSLHAGMHKHMDLFQDEQIIYCIELFHLLFSTIIENCNFKSIELLGLEGNHDRIASNRNQDKNRTAAKVIYRFIQREWKDKINVILAKEGVIVEKRENICIIAHHGDSNLAKAKGEKIVNTFGVSKYDYHLVIKGHLHHLETKEGTNFITLTLPSICSADTYSITEYAENSLPGFILGYQSEHGLGFDFQKITLH